MKMTVDKKTFEFVLDELQIYHIKNALIDDRYAVASIVEETPDSKMIDEDVSENDIGTDIVEDLDKLIALFLELNNRIDKDHEKFYLRCCVVPRE
jgi:hypothetical protein